MTFPESPPRPPRRENSRLFLKIFNEVFPYGLLWLWAGLSSLLIVSSQSENVSWCRRPFHPLITQRNTPAHQYWNVRCSLFREVIKVEKKESVENSTLGSRLPPPLPHFSHFVKSVKNQPFLNSSPKCRVFPIFFLLIFYFDDFS